MHQAQPLASTPPWWRDRLGRPKDVLNITLWVRFLIDRLVTVPAARVLPLGAALWLAEAIGFVDALMPSRSSVTARREIAACSGIAGFRGRRLAALRLAAERRDLVYSVRTRAGKEHIDQWTLIQTNPGPVAELIAARRPFIVASGHFLNSAQRLRFKVLTLDNRPVAGTPARWMLSPLQLHRRLRSRAGKGSRARLFGINESAEERERRQMRVPDLWSLAADWATAPARTPDVQDRAVAQLRQPGATVTIYPDVYWEKRGAYRRPFAGLTDRGFALGAARIARLSGCPIVPFVAIQGPAKRIVTITWGDPIEPGAPEHKHDDLSVMDSLIDFIERQVALHPTQYLNPIGHERRWDATEEKWVDARPASNTGRTSRGEGEPRGARVADEVFR